jgi:uncharacterized membrane protein YciS (DUF1049 family)
MSRVFTGLIWLSVLGLTALAIIFTLYNTQNVTIHYIIATLEIRLVWVLWSSFALGVFLGTLSAFYWILRLGVQNRRLQRSERQASVKIDQLNQKLNIS